jgi:hypothetical protein
LCGSTVQLRSRPLVEGREADKRILARVHVVDILRLHVGLDLQLVGVGHDFHDGLAGLDHAADGMDL